MAVVLKTDDLNKPKGRVIRVNWRKGEFDFNLIFSEIKSLNDQTKIKFIIILELDLHNWYHSNYISLV